MMNRTTYKLLIATVLFLPLCMQGCLKDTPIGETPPHNPTEGEEQVHFDFTAAGMEGAGEREGREGREGREVAHPGTRATVTTIDDVARVGLYGYYTSDERWEWMADNRPSSLKPNYFGNESLYKSENPDNPGNYIWTYTGLARYWPPDTRYKVSYFAYYPYTQTVNPVTGELINTAGAAVVPTPAAPAHTGLPKVEFTVPTQIAAHFDLLRGACIDLTKNGADEIPGTTDDGKVPMVMEHALTRLTFSLQFADPSEAAKYQRVDVLGITISGLHNKGTLRLDNGEWIFDESNPRTEIEIKNAGELSNESKNITGGVNGTDVYDLLHPDVESLMLIPQPLDGINLTVRLRFVDINPVKGELEVPVAYALADTGIPWQAGKSIDYRILLVGEFIAIHTSIKMWTEYYNYFWPSSYDNDVTVGL